MDIPSLKKFMLRNYEQIPGSTDFEYHKLILITGAGMICGTPVSEDEEDKEVGILFKKNHELVQNYRTTYNIPKEKRLAGTDGYIMLENGISISVYSNKVKVYANHTSETVESPVGNLEGYSFIVK